MLERFEKGAQGPADMGVEWRGPEAIMDRTAKVGLLVAPVAEGEVERLRQLTLQAVGAEKANEPVASWFAIGRGLAEYRAGSYISAEVQLRSVATEDGEAVDTLRPN